jgi:hypothetical protein
MGGSFESGAGDDPNDLFASGDDGEEDETSDEVDTRSESADENDTEGQGTVTTSNGESEATEDTTGQASEEGESNERESAVMLDVDSPAELDAGRLAREFVPDSYDKPHAWALGRDGVNDGRAEKKTFFLQTSVLDLEAACSQEVNEILDGDVPLTDLRELALILAYHQPELLAEAARVWGAESA